MCFFFFFSLLPPPSPPQTGDHDLNPLTVQLAEKPSTGTGELTLAGL